MAQQRAFFWILLWLCSSLGLQAASGKILKVLPQYLDLDGHHSLSPSLYERDAYQSFLRLHPEKRSALRFDVNWKAHGLGAAKPVLRVELRSGATGAKPVTVEHPVKPGRFFSTWSSVRLAGKEYAAFGQLLAWRVTLWDGDQLLAEETSFLW